MTDREKLIELAHDYFKSVPWYADIADLNPEELIDHLLTNGVRLESEQATSDENKRWIPVSERLPDEKTLVLCIGVRGGMFLGMTSGSFRSVYGGKPTVYFSVPNARRGRDATHWMPLPEPPKEVSNGQT